MTASPEALLVGRLVQAARAVAAGAEETLALLGPVPDDVAGLAGLDLIRRTAARALLKAVEQQQDVIARLFRTFLSAEGTDTADFTARDIANRMEKLGVLADARGWSDLVRLRNRLAHEYPIEPAGQLARLREAAGAVPALQSVLAGLLTSLAQRGYPV